MADKRPYFMNPEVERVLVVSMTLAQELAVARARIDSLERLLERKGMLTQAEIEGFEPTAAEASQRSQWTQEYLARVLHILQQEAEQLEGGVSGA